MSVSVVCRRSGAPDSRVGGKDEQYDIGPLPFPGGMRKYCSQAVNALVTVIQKPMWGLCAFGVFSHVYELPRVAMCACVVFGSVLHPFAEANWGQRVPRNPNGSGARLHHSDSDSPSVAA